MINWFVDAFIAYGRGISVIFIVCPILALCFRHKLDVKLKDIIVAGALGAGLPLGFLLILVAWMPEIAKKAEFPPEIAILGCVYIIYAGNALAGLWKNER